MTDLQRPARRPGAEPAIVLTDHPPVPTTERPRIQRVIDDAVDQAMADSSGTIADYCRDLREVDVERTAVAVQLVDGTVLQAGDATDRQITLQSVSKVCLLTGLLEDLGPEVVFAHVGMEPSGDSFKSIARLDETPGPPANPLVNAGAIMLSAIVPGHDLAARLAWVDGWMVKLFGKPLPVNPDVLHAERTTGDHNWSIAYLLRAKQLMTCPVEDALEVYFTLCSTQVTVADAAAFAGLLARGGTSLNGERVLSAGTIRAVLAIMTTCGMYDDSGTHLVETGLPTKSGVSGLIVASALRRAGIATFSPRLNETGASVRGQMMLRYIAAELGWHFAEPRDA
ncbi:MAG: glutaminase A [Phycisphaerales bacterium]